jgi:hypothetical protein
MSFPIFSLPDGVTYKDLITGQGGDGPSATKLQYLLAGRCGVLCASIMTLGGVAVYMFAGVADGGYWTANIGLWTAVIGFSSWAKTSQAKQTKEIVIAAGPDKSPAMNKKKADAMASHSGD